MFIQQGSDLLWPSRRDGTRQVIPLLLYIWVIEQSKVCVHGVMASGLSAIVGFTFPDAPQTTLSLKR